MDFSDITVPGRYLLLVNGDSVAFEVKEKAVSYTHLDVYKRQLYKHIGYCHRNSIYCKYIEKKTKIALIACDGVIRDDMIRIVVTYVNKNWQNAVITNSYNSNHLHDHHHLSPPKPEFPKSYYC